MGHVTASALLRLVHLAGFALTCGLCANRCLGEPPNHPPRAKRAEEGQQIVSLSTEGEYVLASTEAGLFRAAKDKGVWRPLEGKGTPEPGGYFVSRRPEDKTLFYFVTPAARQRAADENKNAPPQRPGLYRTEDAGNVWARMDPTHDFSEMVRLPGGRLFALATANDTEKPLVLLSEDEGRNWRDITNDVTKDQSWLILRRDPEHPQRVCLFAPFTIRRGGIVFKAEDDHFRWKESYVGLDAEDWPPDALKSEEEFFRWSYAPSYRVNWPAGTVKGLPGEVTGSFGQDNVGTSSVGFLRARLDNYFDHPFCGETTLPDYYVVPDKASYDFPKKGPMPVQVSLVSYTKEPCPKLVDSPDATLFWSLKIIGPDGQKKSSRLGNDPLGHLEDGNKTLEQSLKERKLEPFQLTTANPHNRTIDLRDLGAFDKPGSYKVQLIYNTGWWRDSEKVMRSLDPVAGQPFSVTITP